MKKLILITILILTTSQITFAQQAIAKIKFEKAQEAYDLKNYWDTKRELDTVEAILKKTNPKVIYLKTMALNKILEDFFPQWEYKEIA